MYLKESKEYATKKGERLISKSASFADNCYWLLIMDEYTHFVWSYFMKTKDEVAGLTINLIKQIQKNKGVVVKHRRCDNAGENVTLQD
jgi:hypothetical protein